MNPTKEPWSTPEHNNDDRSSAEWWEIPGIGRVYKEADARRIVACVNACADVSIEFLEKISVDKLRKDWLLATQQRDGLQDENARLQIQLHNRVIDSPEAAALYQLEAVIQQRDEYKKDAERYRWLRDKGFDVWPSSKALLVYQGVGSDHSLLPEELDAAIDTAIAKMKP